MTLIWGTNYSIVKAAFAEIDPQAFNALRMSIASALFLLTIVGLRGVRPAAGGGAAEPRPLASVLQTAAPITARDWAALAGLGLVGHFLYQLCFIGGLARTSVANSSLILGATPVVVGLLSAAVGQERVSRMHWVGALLSMAGIYLVVVPPAQGAAGAWRGDLLMALAVVCWAIYTVGARPLMTRHSPLGVTGLTMALGTVLYVPAVWPHVAAVDWSGVSAGTWLSIVYSAVFALCVAYTIWYAAVRQLGNARTAVYSNIIPLVAMAVAAGWLGEPLGVRQVLGAAAVLVGVALTRVGHPRVPIPAEE
jgi:drug/metabolite transporter (DMT)-like permease